uniref:ASCH domain-containing protein n=1 Tax=viral metagenome TaxID=1070528 RepID=A0A6C0CA47_9ZZZZ
MEIIWKKHISNPTQTPWLDWIVSGQKTFEGRVYQGDWAAMKIGDTIHFHANNRIVICTITDLKRYADFACAFDDLRDKLVPVQNITRDEVSALYSQYFAADDVKKYGVVAVGVKPL